MKPNWQLITEEQCATAAKAAHWNAPDVTRASKGYWYKRQIVDGEMCLCRHSTAKLLCIYEGLEPHENI